MAFSSVFDSSTTEATLARLDNLTADTQPQWGKMKAGQMLAHLNVGYDITYGVIPVKYNFFMRFMLKTFLKPVVVGKKPYKKNLGTAPVFLIKEEKDFEAEKAKFIANVKKTEQHGPSYFQGKESAAFGLLTVEEWSNQFQVHMEHHFSQFGI